MRNWFLVAAARLITSSLVLADVPDSSHAYAILINGGSRQSSNHLRFWGDMSLAFSMLRHDFGIPRENMKVLWATGDPSADLCKAQEDCTKCRKVQLPLNPADLDRDGVGDIDGPASLSAVEAAFAEFGRRLTVGDQLFVYFTDHGTKYGYEAYAETAVDLLAGFNFWDGEILTDWMLADWTRHLPCPVVFALTTCYSGGVIADLLDSPGIRFVATAAEYVVGHTGNTAPYFDQWTCDFFAALRGYYPIGFLDVRGRGSAAAADTDGDGLVSFREAARFACRHRYKRDYPQYAESWSGCGRRLFPVPRMDAAGVTAYAAAHVAERRGFLGLRRAQALKLADGAVSPEADGADEFPGERLTLAAPSAVTAKGTAQVFLRWKTKPSGADLGPEFDRTSPETEFRMPNEALTLTPVYGTDEGLCSVCLKAVADRSDGDGDESFRWSPDGSAWYRSGDTARLKPGSWSLRWKSLSAAWTAPAGKTKVRLAAGEAYDNAGSLAVFTYVPLADVRVKTLKDGRWTDFAASGKVRVSPTSSGRIAPGRKVTLTASAAGGFAFAGWDCEELAIDSPLSQKLTFKMPADDVAVVSRFVTKADDAASMSFSVAGRELPPGKEIVLSTNILGGVQFSLPVAGSAASKVTVKASGLPAGLSIVKEDASGRYLVTGTPSSTKRITKTVKFTVSTAGYNTKTYRMEITVDPLSTWAFGSFAGYVAGDEEGKDAGAASLTVSPAGKISGKLTISGTNWTCQVNGFSSFRDDVLATNRRFRVTAVAKYGRKTRPLALEVAPGWMTDEADCLTCSAATGATEDALVALRRNVWKDKGTDLKPPVGRFMLDDQGYPGLYAKVSGSGQVTFSGKLDDQARVSASTTAFPDPDGAVRAWLVVPRSKTLPQGLFGLVELSETSARRPYAR